MTIFKKTKAGHPPQSKLERRVASISTPELVVWGENALFAIGKHLVHGSRNGDEAMLSEAEMGAEALLAITRELKKRSRDF
jgi:hypothetical protein